MLQAPRTFPPMRSFSLLVLMVAGALAADPTDPAGAERLIQINDAHWVEREASRFAAALGQDPVPVRRRIAERLYRSRDLNGIDTLRPALLWWGTESGPLTALIPLKDRRIFCDGFGGRFRGGDKNRLATGPTAGHGQTACRNLFQVVFAQASKTI